jgi:hypothetical protein
MIEVVVPKKIKAITVDKKIILNDESELELVLPKRRKALKLEDKRKSINRIS